MVLRFFNNLNLCLSTMKKQILSLLAACAALLFSACGPKADKPLTIVWLPNESGEDKSDTRAEIERIVAEATGREVVSMLSTDYTIAIEALVNNRADMAYLGAQGYVEANRRNNKILPLVTYTGPSGTLEDAVYYAWLAVRSAEAPQFQANGAYSLDTIAGKRFSFVSSSSTSGFVIPSAVVVNHFRNQSAWANLQAEDLIEGGAGKLFSEVLFGGSHVGTALNLLSNRADVVALASSQLLSQLDLVSGDTNRAGAAYTVRADAKDPLDRFVGAGLTLISSTPVLNEPFVANHNTLSATEVAAIQAALISGETANNTKIFVPRGSSTRSLLTKSGDERFLAVDDAWFQPIRDLSK